ncbi:concanavalin A-like lectin/glucanase domain-containing protein [Pseudomassariella vexata]|uniref:endo-1,3(4)-beta-glucanase n=1 Tax=Pseudomassariella vexata TaxID=1141098 RepID=A0A1Y2E3Z2_9PEZI|nr:concanavalin A-like lectin/glucanase domain-containing protein [Pseudomassariella vexata]ORY66278.1 concanavalin A-like lectin/glucanase domain-containing protein [Pseudomassariella vexata]
MAAQAAYTIQDTYDATNFFDTFDFFSGQDPTNGFVEYNDKVSANESSLAGYANDGIYLGVDHTTQNPTPGRGSVRLTSKKAYTKGLIVADIAHMPHSSKNGCGVWPALWTFGPNWPSSGEIDILEGVNSQTSNIMTLHTSEGCSFSQGDCQGNQGCSSKTNDSTSYGAGMNKIGGGVYAIEWTSQAISIWWFPRTKSTPADIDAGTPSPASWGAPAAKFAGSGCNIDDHFINHNIVFNIDFCGDWAGKVFSTDSTCSSLASTCEDYVAKNPADFKEAYFLINSVKVFSKSGSAPKRDGLTTPKAFRA